MGRVAASNAGHGLARPSASLDTAQASILRNPIQNTHSFPRIREQPSQVEGADM